MPDRAFAETQENASPALISLDNNQSADDWPQFRGPAGDGISPATKLPLLLPGVLAFLLLGCASSKLSLKLDIYGEDPRVADLTPEQLDDYVNALKQAPADIKEYSKDRGELGRGIYELYESGAALKRDESPSSAERKAIDNRKTQWETYTMERVGAKLRFSKECFPVR